MDYEKYHRHSFIVRVFTGIVEWGNEWLTLSHWIFRRGELIFVRIEAMMLVITAFCITLPFWVDHIPSFLYPLVYVFFIQRVLEFVIIYSRNFILKRGRIYSHTQFESDQHRGIWLVLMFTMSVFQLVMIFASTSCLLSNLDPNAYSHTLGGLDSVYFSAMTFLTVGYGDIVPLSMAAKIVAMIQGALTYFTLVVVINGLSSAHFGNGQLSEEEKKPQASE